MGKARRNPRRANGHRRDQLLRWLRAQERPCWICGLPIDYDLPPGNPRCFECDELVPVSKGGNPLDHANVDAAHRVCNEWRGNKSVAEVRRIRARAARLGRWRTPEQFVALAKRVVREVRRRLVLPHSRRW